MLHGLDPATTYVYSVSIFDMVGSSTRSEESLFTTMEHRELLPTTRQVLMCDLQCLPLFGPPCAHTHLAVVGHVQTKVLNSTAVGVSWSPLHLPPGVTVSLYTVQYRNSGSTKETQIFSGTETCGEIGGLTPQTEYSFRVVSTIVDVDGSVSEGRVPGNGSTIFVPGEPHSAFTIQLEPRRQALPSFPSLAVQTCRYCE